MVKKGHFHDHVKLMEIEYVSYFCRKTQSYVSDGVLNTPQKNFASYWDLGRMFSVVLENYFVDSVTAMVLVARRCSMK